MLDISEVFPRTLAAALTLVLAMIVGAQAATAKTVKFGVFVGGSQFISEFQNKSIVSSGPNRANLAFGASPASNPIAITFDKFHDMWISYFNSGESAGAPVIELTPMQLSQLKAGVGITPTVIIQSPKDNGVPFMVAQSIAFDKTSDLWISDGSSHAVVELKQSQLLTNGGPHPVIKISDVAFNPNALRFDASFNLWVGNFTMAGEPEQILRLTSTDRATSGSPNPSLTLTLPNTQEVQDLAFDKTGNLWVACNTPTGVVIEQFQESDLEGNGSVAPAPTVTLTSPIFGGAGAGPCVGGIDFDPQGNLWTTVGTAIGTCNATPQVAEFSAASLVSGGSVSPALSITENGNMTNLLMPGPLRVGHVVN